jgi:hypothetical protein
VCKREKDEDRMINSVKTTELECEDNKKRRKGDV